MNDKPLDAPLSIPVSSVTPDILTITPSGTTAIIRIDKDGRLFWKQREVDTDDDFRAAMLDLAKHLFPQYAQRSETAPTRDEGYPGIAHDFETMRTALKYIASLPDSYPASAIIERAKDALKNAAPQVPEVREAPGNKPIASSPAAAAPEATTTNRADAKEKS